MHRAGDVPGLLIPALGDELPVQLCDVRMAQDHVVDAVRDHEMRGLVAVARVNLEAHAVAAVLHLVGEVVSRLRKLVGYEGTVDHLARLDHVDRDGAALELALWQVPVHAVEASVEGEHALLADLERAVGRDRGIDVDLRDRVFARVGGNRDAQAHDEHEHEGDERPCDAYTTSCHGSTSHGCGA